MTTNLPDPNRKLLPRWRPYIKTAKAGELNSLSNSHTPLVNELSENLLKTEIDKWRKDKSLAVATDVLGTAVLSNKTIDLTEIAEFIVNNENAPATSLEISRNILSNKENPLDFVFIEKPIHNHLAILNNLKKRVKEEPRNTIVYVDLALHYTILGQYDKAKKALNIALKLAPNNRFVLRSAARFFIHIDKKEIAHKILRRSEIGAYDPWVAASEIAVANFADNPSRFAKNGIKELSNKKYHDKDLSELASALATLEMTHGKHKKSNQLFKQSLIEPNDNTVAQAEWAIRHGQSKLHLDDHILNSVPCAFEAKAWEFMERLEWKDSLEQTKLWYHDQPFSTLPAVICSYIETVIFGNYEIGIKYLLEAHKLKPEDLIIINDLAFNYASINKLNEAEELLNKINLKNLEGLDKVALTATKGLLAFRKGDIETGQNNYIEAIQLSKSQSKKTQLTANIYFTREALLAKLKEGQQMAKIVCEQLELIDSDEHRILFKREIEPIMGLSNI